MLNKCAAFLVFVLGQLFLVCAFCTESLHAQEIEVTVQNIALFTGIPNSELGLITCYRGEGGDGLGQVWSKRSKKPNYAQPGSIFRPLTPSVTKRVAKLSKDLNTLNKKLRLTKSARAKARLRKTQVQLTKRIQQHYKAQQWCADIRSAIPVGPGDPGDNEPEDDFQDLRQSLQFHIAGNSVFGSVTGGTTAIVTLGNDRWLQSVTTTDGSYKFEDVPHDTYFLRAEASGYSFGPAHSIIVDGATGISNDPEITLEARQVTSNGFRFHWNDEPLTRSGQEYNSSTVSTAALDAIMDSSDPSDISAANTLYVSYAITLNDDTAPWSTEHANRLLKTLSSVWDEMWGPFPNKTPSTWHLTNVAVPDDILIETTPSGSLDITVSSPAFSYAEPIITNLDGVQGTFFSRRLYKAIARFATRNGSDAAAVQQILRERYKIELAVGDPTWLTWKTTQEGPESFQEFSASERIWLLTSYAELPEGLTNGAGYDVVRVVRRKNSVPHPKFPSDPIVVWAGQYPWESYIEFMHDAFLEPRLRGRITDEPLRVFKSIIASRAFLIWKFQVSQTLQAAWIELGSWYYDPSSKKWNTTKPTEVGKSLITDSDPAPGEDFANSIAEYLAAPEQLRYRSPERYEFIMQRIMHGYRYIRQLRPDLQFEVLNLHPDYSYPGKIKTIDIRVRGDYNADKTVSIDITLEGTDLLKDGALYGFTTIKNKDGSGQVQVTFSPVDPDPETGLSLRFHANIIISKYAASGAWEPERITFVDGVQNMKIQNRDTFGWKLFIKNPATNPEAPTLVPGSTTLRLGQAVIEGQLTPTLIASAQIDHANTLDFACFYFRWLLNTRGDLGQCSMTLIGNTVQVEMPFSPYRPSDQIGITQLMLAGKTLLTTNILYTSNPKPGDEAMPIVDWVSPDSDTAPPEVDLNDIHISAVTIHPEAPDGQTAISVTMRARDDKAGLKWLTYCLKSPFDLYVCRSFDSNSARNIYYSGDPTAWVEKRDDWTMPKGSAPGTWGIASIGVEDLAGNYKWHNLTELIHFKVDGN